MVNKRKRDDLSDSDSDDIAPGRQILPVANLPHDFDQEPQDGMQYLFLARRDARRLPHVTRARNPYELPEIKIAPTLPSSTNVLPCDEWRMAFQTHFSNLRKNLTQTTIHVDHDQSRRKTMPEKKDRNAWWKFLTGHPESTWGPMKRSVRKKLDASHHTRTFGESADQLVDAAALLDVASHFPITSFDDYVSRCQVDNFRVTDSTDSVSLAGDVSILSKEDEEDHVEHLSPPEITPNHLREIDHRMSIHLLMYFTHWINIHLQNPNDPLATISVGHGQWIFALLTKIEDHISADEMNLLRNLARACLGLLQKCKGRHLENNAAPRGILGHALMTDTSCWMIFAAIAGHWGQKDLWADAESTLARV